MTDETTVPTTASLPETASVGRVLRDQRKTIWVAVVLMVLGLFVGQYDEWTLRSASPAACCSA